MQISVIIPVYNAAPYVQEAVKSALAQPETAEVILIEDGSPDDSLRVCNELADKYESVRLLRHPNGENRGAAASRNLGIRESQYDVIAFLDADDFYTPNRFRVSGRILAEQPEIDGVYEAFTIYFNSPDDKRRWQELYGFTGEPRTLRALSPNIASESLFKYMFQRGGPVHLDGLTVRKTALDDVGGFPDALRVAQDTMLIRKLAAVKTLIGGVLDTPVANVRVHSQNRVAGATITTRKQQQRRLRTWLHLWLWGRSNLTNLQKQIMVNELIRFIEGDRLVRSKSEYAIAILERYILFLHVLFKAPELTLYLRFWWHLMPQPRALLKRIKPSRIVRR